MINLSKKLSRSQFGYFVARAFHKLLFLMNSILQGLTRPGHAKWEIEGSS